MNLSMPLQLKMTRRFRPRFWFTVVALTMFTLMLATGNWQLDRAEQKLQRQASLQANLALPAVDLARVRPSEALLYRHVVAQGQWLPQQAILIDNKVYHGMVGYQLVVPFRIAGTG